ncbi:MAG: thioredoxin family protein [Bernardetiaceae bacterium]|nr:thioredoxin family protein [Bernardetiaceae bacterium]
MNNKILTIALIAIVGFITLSTTATAAKINFETGTWEEVRAKAKKADKIIFIDAYATWCGPCKKMDKETFTDAKVAAFFNKNFIPYKIDVDTEAGGKLFKQYGGEAMPTYLFVDADENLVYKTLGFMPAEPFLAVGKTALEVPAIKKRFAEGDRSPEFVAEYLVLMADSGDPEVTELAQQHLASLKPEELVKPENFKILSSYVRDLESEHMQYFINNADVFVEALGDEVLNYLDPVLNALFQDAVQNKNEERLAEIEAMLSKCNSILPEGATPEDIMVKVRTQYKAMTAADTETE